MGSQSIFPNTINYLVTYLVVVNRNARSLYHSNFLNRIDTMGVVLNYGETPIVRSRMLNYIHENQHPYGFNTIVAIIQMHIM